MPNIFQFVKKTYKWGLAQIESHLKFPHMNFIAVVGSRTKNRDDHVRCGQLVENIILTKLNKRTDVLVSGGAQSGADWWCRQLANKHRYGYLEAPAFWSRPDGTFFAGAGPVRNRVIAQVCSVVYAVWDGKSKGTENAINEAKALDRIVEVIQL